MSEYCLDCQGNYVTTNPFGNRINTIKLCPKHGMVDDLLRISKAAVHAMQSYRHGNSDPALAEEIAKEYETIIAKAEEKNE